MFAIDLAENLGGAPDNMVVALATGSTGNRLEIPSLGNNGRWDPRGFARLVELLRRHDVLVAHGSSALLHGAVAGRVTRRPFVYRNIGDPSAWGSVRAANLRIGAPLRRAAAVAALYPAARDFIIRSYSLEPDRVVTIPNGVKSPTTVDRPEPVESRKALGLGDEVRWVGFIGALSPEKGVMAAIEAVASDESLGLAIAGDGQQRAEAVRLADDLASERVRFLGVLDDAWELFNAVDVVVLPSRTEGIPATAIEAGLAHRPVVATTVGGIPEVVENGVTGLLIDDTRPAPLVAALSSAIEHREALGHAAHARCTELFSMEHVTGQWRDLLERVVNA